MSNRDEDFSKAKAYLDAAYANEKKGSWNWFQYQASIVKLLLFQGKYEEAQSHYNDIKQQSKFKLLLERDLIPWKTFDLYFSWLSAKAQLDESEDNFDLDENETLDKSSALWLGHSLLLGLHGPNGASYANRIKEKPTYLDQLRKAGYFKLTKQINDIVFKEINDVELKDKYATYMAHHELLFLEEIIPFERLKEM